MLLRARYLQNSEFYKNLFAYVIKKFCFLFFFLLSIVVVKSQQNIDFQNDYDLLKVEMNNDVDHTLVKLDQFIKSAEVHKNFQFVSKGFYLKSFGYLLKGNSSACLENADKALEVATKYNYPEEQALAYRIKGTQYAKMNLFEMADEYFEKGLSLVERRRSQESYEIRGLIYNSQLVALGDTQDEDAKRKRLAISL